MLDRFHSGSIRARERERERKEKSERKEKEKRGERNKREMTEKGERIERGRESYWERKRELTHKFGLAEIDIRTIHHTAVSN